MPRVTIDVRGMPELIADLRREIADTLREIAEMEPSPRLASRLRDIATAYEVGQRATHGEP